MNDQLKNSANITDQASRDNTDAPANQLEKLTQSLVLVKMQVQSSRHGLTGTRPQGCKVRHNKEVPIKKNF